jgi:hypothetical protein
MSLAKQCADPARIADGFAVASSFVPRLAVEVDLRAPAQLTWRTAAGTIRMALLHQNHHRSLGGALAKLAGLADKETVLALRERAHDLAPTWKDTLAKRAAFMAKDHARWISFEREDASRLLALASLVAAARSGDVTDLTGRKVPLEAVRKWVSDALDVPSWPILGFVTSPSSRAVDEPIPPADVSAPKASGVAMSVLLRLRVASLDRLVRESARLDRTANRSSVVLELERAGDGVRWVGTALVCVKGES